MFLRPPNHRWQFVGKETRKCLLNNNGVVVPGDYNAMFQEADRVKKYTNSWIEVGCPGQYCTSYDWDIGFYTIDLKDIHLENRNKTVSSMFLEVCVA